MHRVSVKHNIDRQTLWSLRYRKPRDIMARAYLRLKAAYQAEIEHQEAKLAHELEITKHLRGHNATPSPAVVEAEAVLGAAYAAPETSARSSAEIEE